MHSNSSLRGRSSKRISRNHSLRNNWTDGCFIRWACSLKTHLRICKSFLRFTSFSLNLGIISYSAERISGKGPDLGIVLISGYARFSDTMEHKGDLIAIDQPNEWIFHNYASLAILFATGKLVERWKCTHDMRSPWISLETCHCGAKWKCSFDERATGLSVEI
jgi:hypothetical protein